MVSFRHGWREVSLDLRAQGEDEVRGAGRKQTGGSAEEFGFYGK